MTKKRRVIWAVDPFDAEARPSPLELARLRKWLTTEPTEMELVHVACFPPDELPAGEQASRVERLEHATKQALRQQLEAMQVGEVSAVRLLPARSESIAAQVETLAAYARDMRADWILVSSKGNTGLMRLALGSFAEQLLLRSPIPVRVLGRESPPGAFRPGEGSWRILFPTDFSDASRGAFDRVAADAARTGASITLLHLMTLPPGLILGGGAFGIGVTVPGDRYVSEEAVVERDQAEAMAMLARRQGVRVEVDVRLAQGPVAEEIARAAAESGADEIALASSRGPVSSFILGSVARQVVRDGRNPVKVYTERSLP